MTRVIGLTGGIGMGKSASAALLQERGVAVVDTDLLAHQLVEPGQSALARIQTQFGEAMVDRSGSLRRDALAELVFHDEAARARLEGILHPLIRECWQAQVQTWKTEDRPLAVVVIPLLFETGAETGFDATVCVACSATTQRQRLLARGWSASQLEGRIRAQWPAEQKIARADYVVWTEADMEIHARQLDRILDALTRQSGPS